MISVDLIGRMGNNLFQIGACLSLAKRHSTSARCTSREGHLSAFELMNISYGPQPNRGCKYYNETKFNFYESFFGLPANTHMHGYFQSYRYLEGAEDVVRSNFAIKPFVRDNVNANGFGYLDDPENGVTCLHVRRTDYLQFQHCHPCCGMEYYKQCLEEIAPKGKVIVISDDLGWCKDNFHGGAFEFADLDHHCCMYIMTRVKNIVIANSSFSWWGAWLNNRSDKTVYAPKQWFGNTLPYREADINLENCIKDVFPPSWNKR